MLPIFATFLSMISFLLLATDRTSVEVQALDDGVPRSALDVAKRTLPLRLPHPRSASLRRGPRSAVALEDVMPEAWKLVHALRKRDIRDQLWGPATRVSKTNRNNTKKPQSRRKTNRENSLGELRDDLMVHGRDRDQLKKRWKIEDGNNRVANIHG